MQNIRLSINVQKLSGVRILRSNNHAGDPTNYVAIPLSISLFHAIVQAHILCCP